MRLSIHPVFLALAIKLNCRSNALSPRYRRAPLPDKLVPRTFSMDVATECEIDPTNDDTTTLAGDANGESSMSTTTNGGDSLTSSNGVQSLLPSHMLQLPNHSNESVNDILKETELLIRQMHRHSKNIDPGQAKQRTTVANNYFSGSGSSNSGNGSNLGDSIFANSYVDLGKVDTVG